MSEITYNPVRLYTDNDLYEVNTDNRPLLDIISNLNLVTKQLGNLGFYVEAKANPETEPAGGFAAHTCACVRENNLLYPIDVTKSIAEVDYTKYPIILVTEYNAETTTYKCLSFSALYKIPARASSFLLESVGNPLKIGPGGVLVDSYYFDMYYSAKSYQNIIVGKIASTTELSFGGNQVGVLGDSHFIQKNIDDSTSGLVTVFRDNKESNTVFKSTVLETVGSPYVFSEFLQVYKPDYSAALLPTPVYFTNSPLVYNQSTGLFLESELDSKLNEIHFKSPVVDAVSSDDSVVDSAGITVGSLRNFSSSYLLHSSSYSNLVSETSQNISTDLVFSLQDLDTNAQTTANVKFQAISRSLGTAVNASIGVPNALTNTSANQSGITFGDYGSLGSYIGAVKDDPTGVVRLSSEEEDALSETLGLTSVKLSNMENSYSLLIHSMSDDSTVGSNIFVLSDGYLVLSGNNGGVHVVKQCELDTEVANKKYVDRKFNSITDASVKKIPLSGTTETDVISGALEFNVASNTDSASIVLKLVGLSNVDIYSNNVIRFLDSTASGSNALQSVELYTTAAKSDSDAGWNSSEAVNKGFLRTYVSNALLGNSNESLYVTVAGNDTQAITGKKLFNTLTEFTSNIKISSDNPTIEVTPNKALTIVDESGTLVSVKAKETVDADDSSTLTSKGYVDSKIVAVKLGSTPAWAAWNSTSSTYGGMIANSTPDNATEAFSNFVTVTSNGTDSVFVIKRPCTLHIKLGGTIILSDAQVYTKLSKNNTVIATATNLTSTTAAGTSSVGYPLDLDVYVTCNQSDVLKFDYETAQIKDSGTIKSISTQGYIEVVS